MQEFPIGFYWLLLPKKSANAAKVPGLIPHKRKTMLWLQISPDLQPGKYMPLTSKEFKEN